MAGSHERRAGSAQAWRHWKSIKTSRPTRGRAGEALQKAATGVPTPRVAQKARPRLRPLRPTLARGGHAQAHRKQDSRTIATPVPALKGVEPVTAQAWLHAGYFSKSARRKHQAIRRISASVIYLAQNPQEHLMRRVR